MLTFTSRSPAASPEETLMDALLIAEAVDKDGASPWIGHPFRLRTAMRDGTEVVFGFSLTECAEILTLLNDDPRIRTWLDLVRFPKIGSTLN